MPELGLSWSGAPRTKKTHNQLVRAGRRSVVLPSAAYRAYEATTVPLLRIAMQSLRTRPAVAIPGRLAALSSVLLPGPIDARCNLRAHVYRDADRGDLIGYLQAICDLLQEGGVLVNDRLVTSFDGSRLMLDRRNPRVELVLSW